VIWELVSRLRELAMAEHVCGGTLTPGRQAGG
jgi:hypothetical protein